MIIKNCLLIFLFSTVKTQLNEDYYTGAVVEYAPTYNRSLTITKNIQNNCNQYILFIKEAKDKGVDIIVFPEYGLTTRHVEKDVLSYTSIIPDPKNKLVLCDTEILTSVLKRLSCAAKNNSIYVVVNLLERMSDDQTKNVKIFNTNVVFDRKGALIARYRKFNLFEEPINVTDTPDLTYFETDFNVTFGVFICFDILFSKPSLELLRIDKKITDIVYSSAWISQLPFLTAVQTQAGWARANGVNLLASGYSEPTYSVGGSGIYQASGNITIDISEKGNSTLIIKKIKKLKERHISENAKGIIEGTDINYVSNLKLTTENDNMTNYNTVLLNETVENYKLCHNGLNCEFTIKMSSQKASDYLYRMVVFNGFQKFPIIPNYIQICGLTACKNTSIESCGERISNPQNPTEFEEILIKGKFIDESSSVIFPTNVLYNLTVLNPSDFTYKTKLEKYERFVELKTVKKVKEILGFGVYSVLKNPSKGKLTECESMKESVNNESQLSGGLITIIVLAILTVVASAGFLAWQRLRNYNSGQSIFK